MPRVGIASTIGVYAGNGAQGALTEDMPLAMSAPHLIPTFKKIGELLDDYLAGATGIEIVNYRISGTWGPLGHSDPFFPAPELIHAAAAGRAPDLSGLRVQPHAGDGLDLCYVKDTGRAIALLQLADKTLLIEENFGLRVDCVPYGHQKSPSSQNPPNKCDGRGRWDPPPGAARTGAARERCRPVRLGKDLGGSELVGGQAAQS